MCSYDICQQGLYLLNQWHAFGVGLSVCLINNRQGERPINQFETIIFAITLTLATEMTHFTFKSPELRKNNHCAINLSTGSVFVFPLFKLLTCKDGSP